MAFCTNCGAKLDDDAKFCIECGTKVETAPSEPTVAPASAPAPDIRTYSYDPAAPAPGGTQPPMPPRDIPGGSMPQKKKTPILPLILIAVGVAALALLLIGFFGNKGDADDPACGVYIASYGSFAGMRVEIEDMWSDGFTIELLPKNKCRVEFDGQTETCRYTLENDGEIEIDIRGDEDLEGRLLGNCLTLEDVLDSGVDLVFYKEGTAAPAVENPVITEAPAIETPVETPIETPVDSSYAWWNGDWYGWWVIWEGGGDYSDLEDTCYDTCATIYVDGDVGIVDLWDQDNAEGENIGYIDVAFEPGTTDKGRMVSVSGNFYDGEIGAGDWVVDPGDSVVSRFDSMIAIDGMYYQKDNSANWVHYIVFLRPWGMSWDDVRADACEDMPYSDMMPPLYDDWYVPHKDGEMPDHF